MCLATNADAHAPARTAPLAAGTNKRKGTRQQAAEQQDDYGSGRFGGQLDREMQFFEKVKARLRNREQYQVRACAGGGLTGAVVVRVAAPCSCSVGSVLAPSYAAA